MPIWANCHQLSWVYYSLFVYYTDDDVTALTTFQAWREEAKEEKMRTDWKRKRKTCCFGKATKRRRRGARRGGRGSFIYTTYVCCVYRFRVAKVCAVRIAAAFFAIFLTTFLSFFPFLTGLGKKKKKRTLIVWHALEKEEEEEEVIWGNKAWSGAS